MDLLFLDQAANAAAANENPMATWGMLGFTILLFIVMYFLFMRPYKKKQKEEEEMRSSIEISDDVTTIGGIVGKIIAIREDDETFVLETGSDKTRLRFKKWAVSSIDTPEKQPKKDSKKKDESKKTDKKNDKDAE